MKYNQKNNGIGPNSVVKNHAGADAYTLDNRSALYMTCATSLGGGAIDKYYVTKNKEYASILDLIEKVVKTDPEFVFQLAAFCRKDMYLRSIPTVLFIEGIRAMHKQKSTHSPYPVDASKYAKLVFGRADEIVEATAYWFLVEGHHKLPSPLRKSLQIAMNQFDEYRLLKYNQTDKAVTFKDIVRLVHPEPKNETQNAIFRYFVKDEVAPALMPKTVARKALLKRSAFDDEARRLITESHATWETVVSKFGSTKEVWESVLPNMGYMALLRNLNNFLKTDVNLEPVIQRLTNPQEVLNSKQMPFRFYSALKALNSDTNEMMQYSSYSNVDAEFSKWVSKIDNTSSSKIQKLRNALGTALNISIDNIPLSGRSVVAADLSGSMSTAFSDKSTITYREIAALMAGCATQITQDNIAIGFGEVMEVAKNGNNALETAQNIDKLQVGHSTNAYLILEYLLKNRIFVNRVMYFTDTQCYGGYARNTIQELWNKYKSLIVSTGLPKPYLYEINLAGGNTSSFKREENVAQIGGWSDKVFALITAFETDPRTVVNKIKEQYGQSLVTT